MALPGLAVIGAGVDLGKTIVGIFEKHPDDPKRLKDNATALSRVPSNRGYIDFLKARSGQYGRIVFTNAIPSLSSKSPAIPVGGTMGGWATAKARNDAYNKVQGIAAEVAALGGGQGATPKLAGDNPVGQPRDGNAGNVTPSLASVVSVESFTKYAPHILVGITVLWALKYARKMR